MKIKSFIWEFDPESGLEAKELVKYNEDGSFDWRGTGDRTFPFELDVEADEIIVLDQESPPRMA